MKIFKNIFRKTISNETKDFDYFFSDISKILKFFSLDFWNSDWSLCKVLRLLIPIVLSFLYAVVFEVIFLIYYQDYPDIILESLFVSGGTEMFLIKLATTLWNREKIVNFLKQIKNEFWVCGENNDLKRKILLKGSRKMKLYVRIYIGLFMLTTTVCEIRPIIAIIFFGKFESPLLMAMPGIVKISE